MPVKEFIMICSSLFVIGISVGYLNRPRWDRRMEKIFERRRQKRKQKNKQ